MMSKKLSVFGMSALALALGMSGAAHAGSLVTNGGFETTTNGGGQLGYNTDATGWSTSGYNFLFPSGTADNGTGVSGQYGNLQLWGPGNGSANGLPASSPDGGNYVAADGAYSVGPISQTISGLTVGSQYAVSFYWAGAQQYGFTSPTQEQWNVSLGSDTQSTAIVNNVNHGFTGWMGQTFTYTATSTSEVLSFLAYGTPSGVPPFALLDGVTMNAVPEPSAMVLMGIGAAGFGIAALRRRAKSATTTTA